MSCCPSKPTHIVICISHALLVAIFLATGACSDHPAPDEGSGNDLGAQGEGRDGATGASSPGVTPDDGACGPLERVAAAGSDGFLSLRGSKAENVPRPADRVDDWWPSTATLPEFERCFIGGNQSGSTWWCERSLPRSEIASVRDHWVSLVSRCLEGDEGWNQHPEPASLAAYPWPDRLDPGSRDTTSAWTDGEQSVVIDIAGPAKDRAADPRLVVGIAARAAGATEQGHAEDPDDASDSGSRVAAQIEQLRNGASYKLRLAAALALSKSRSRTAIPAFIDVLSDDEDKNLRGVAASSLGKLITSRTRKQLRSKAIAALEEASKGDSSSFVREQAEKALAAIKSASSQRRGGVYVNIGAMSVKASGARSMKQLMRSTARKAFARKGSSMFTKWPGGDNPSAQELRSSGTKAFHVDGTLTSLTTQPKGSSTVISCKLSVLVATYPKKSMFGFLDGGATVQTGSSDSDIERGKEDCVAAVLEDLIVKKIIPTIKSRVP